ncbi:MAG: prolyl oligopeptidase family serine peptidase [Pseudomonadota bacterium]
MKFLKAPLMAAVLGTSVLGLSVAAPSETQATPAVPIDVWALRDVVNTVDLSPDGKHLLVHINPSREGEYLLQIYKVDDMSTPYRTLNADPMEIFTARWVSDNVIVGRAWEQKRTRVRRQEDDTRNYATYFYNLEANKFSQVSDNLVVVNTLPNEPDRVLVAAPEANASLGVDPFQAFRPRSFYKLNLRTGSKSLVIRGTSKYGRIQFDNDGNPRYAEGIDGNKVKTYYRKPGDGSWTQFGPEYDQNDHTNLYRFLSRFQGFWGFDHENTNIGYLIETRNGADKASLWEFNFETGQYGRELFKSEESDVMGIGLHSIPGNNKLAWAMYPGAKREMHFFDEDEAALYAALESQIPYAHQVRISSRSYDGRTMVVTNSGPKDPGSFWLVKDGQLAKLGSRNPLLNQDALADVKYIRYPSRDGKLMIPGYVTIPKGEGPFPLIVQHNGGPHVNAVQGYSEFGQMFASAGYMVLYPQNRISTGWGKQHFDAGYGEHGLAMQDDKDDGVKYLIEQGLVDPDRVAFWGWSYGGYAALVALSREEQLYQCAIAINAVADPAKSFRLGAGRAGSGAAKAFIDWAERRGSIGINPIAEVDKVNIPLLMVHGSVDRRVLYYHFEDYQKAFEAAGKTGEFVTLVGADHFGATQMFNHQQQLYTKMFDYLANDCGPGGL